MANPEYEKTLKPYSPESVKSRMNHPNMAKPGNEKCAPVSKPVAPKD